eukprot:5709620-Pleurochrysis_carterae.AAC.1
MRRGDGARFCAAARCGAAVQSGVFLRRRASERIIIMRADLVLVIVLATALRCTHGLQLNSVFSIQSPVNLPITQSSANQQILGLHCKHASLGLSQLVMLQDEDDGKDGKRKLNEEQK